MHGRRTRAKRKKQYKNRRISPRQRRNRRILGAAIAAILIVLFLTSFFARPKPRIWYSYEVAPGDTLWAICRSEYGEGDTAHRRRQRSASHRSTAKSSR